MARRERQFVYIWIRVSFCVRSDGRFIRPFLSYRILTAGRPLFRLWRLAQNSVRIEQGYTLTFGRLFSTVRRRKSWNSLVALMFCNPWDRGSLFSELGASTPPRSRLPAG